MGGSEYAVVVVGGGPTGMMLAAELKLAGIEVMVLERRTGPGGRRFDGRAASTRGRWRCSISAASSIGSLPTGQTHQGLSLAGVALDISAFPTRHNYGLALGQQQFERILGGWCDELERPDHPRGRRGGIRAGRSGIDVELSRRSDRCERHTSSAVMAGAA